MTIGIMRLSAIGDVCNALSAVTVLKQKHPTAKFIWFIGKTEHSFLKGLPGVDFEIVDKKSTLKEFLRLKAKYRNTTFDSILHMQRAIRCSLLVKALRAKKIIGFDALRAKELQSLFTTESISKPKTPHAVEAFMEFAFSMGVERTTKPAWDYGPLNKDSAKHFKTTYGDYVCLVPSGSQLDRAWPVERFVEVANHILKKTPLNLVLIGNSPFERSQAEKITEALNKSSRVFNLTGKTSLEELKVCISQCEFMIAPDTGPAHIASSFNKPVVGIYVHMPTNITGPYNSMAHCVDKYEVALKKYYNQTYKASKDKGIPKRIKINEAIKLITSKEVIEKVEALLKRALLKQAPLEQIKDTKQ